MRVFVSSVNDGHEHYRVAASADIAMSPVRSIANRPTLTLGARND